MFFSRPKIERLIQDELYQAEREVLGMEERVFRYNMAAAASTAQLDLMIERRDNLRDQVRMAKKDDLNDRLGRPPSKALDVAAVNPIK